MDVFYSTSSSSSSSSFGTANPVAPIVRDSPQGKRLSTSVPSIPAFSPPTKLQPLSNTEISSSDCLNPQQHHHSPPHETRSHVMLPPLLQQSFNHQPTNTTNFANNIITTTEVAQPHPHYHHNDLHKPVPVATAASNMDMPNAGNDPQQQQQQQPQNRNEDFILPPVSALLHTPPPPMYSLQSSTTSVPSSPFKIPLIDSYRSNLTSPVSSTTNHEFSNDQISSSGCSTASSTDFEHQKKAFQNYVKNVAIREEKQVVKMSQEQQVSLVLKVLKHNQLRMAQALESSPRSHHTISAQLLENGRILDVYVFIRKKPNCVMDRKTLAKEFRLENFSFNVVVLGKKSQNNVHKHNNQQLQ
nr:unnamed protein product [Naegleria fowleri]